MDKQKQGILTSEKPICGFHPVDLLGILIMIIPFIISIQKWEITKRILFINLTKEITIHPSAITTLLAVVFYAALIIRFDFYKAKNIAQALISSARMFLDCWVLAALLSFALPANQPKLTLSSFIKIIQNPQIMLLVFAVALTWLGMKTVAGYSWILFILSSWSHAVDVNNAMGTTGAVFVLTIAISLFLQVRDLNLAKDFLRDFKKDTQGFTHDVNDSISRAATDAAQRANDVSNFVKDNVAAYTPIKIRTTPQNQTPVGTKPVYYVGKNTEQTTPVPSRSMPEGNAEDILKALDVNGDGVVDEKDIELLRKK